MKFLGIYGLVAVSRLRERTPIIQEIDTTIPIGLRMNASFGIEGSIENSASMGNVQHSIRRGIMTEVSDRLFLPF